MKSDRHLGSAMYFKASGKVWTESRGFETSRKYYYKTTARLENSGPEE